MKEAIITVRLPRATRRRLETLAHREGRSLSQQVERLVEQGLAGKLAPPRPGARVLSGLLSVGQVPSLAHFHQVRAQLSASLAGRLADRGQRRR